MNAAPMDGTETDKRIRIVAVIDFPRPLVEAGQRYESLVLPLLADHGGRVDQRLRTPEGCTEVHLLSFESREGYESFLGDPRRSAYQESTGVELHGRVLEVQEVSVDEPTAATSRSDKAR
jgi:hypothetical protein